MPYTEPPVNGVAQLPYQTKNGYDATAEGQQDAAQQSNPEHAYDATPNVSGAGGRWMKVIDGGQIDMNTGQPTGAGWMPDGTSDASRWKGV
jgi:hypothetical protein